MLSVAESPRASAIAPRRRYARIPEVLEIPNLIELQLSSFTWFVEKGLRELLDEIRTCLEQHAGLLCRRLRRWKLRAEDDRQEKRNGHQK